jgi:hypothetical protein
MNPSVCSAIAGRAVVRFQYDGGLRIVEPHCHGMSPAGNEVLRGYQIGGFSASGSAVGWRLFEVPRLSGWIQTDDTFLTNSPGYNPNDRGMTVIHCHV